MTIEAKLSSIYRAAHERLPAQSSAFAEHAEVLGAAIGPAVTQAHTAGAFALSENISTLGEELFFRLRSMVRILNESAIGLERIADDFVTTDEAVSGWFASHQQWVRDHPGFGSQPELPALPRLPEQQAGL